jgi:hypothetical protein
MTTMTIQEELAKLGTVTAADIKKEEAAQNVFRPESRPAVVSGHGRVQITGRIQKSGTRQDGTTWSSEALGIRVSNLTNIKVARGRLPYTESSFEYEIAMPKDETKPHHSSAMGLTIKALGEGRTILAIADAECDFEEEFHQFLDKDGNTQKDSDGYLMKPVFYYRFYNIGGAQPAAATTASLEGEETACAFAAGKTDSELTPNTFLQGFIQAGGTDTVVQAEIAGRKFLSRMMGESKLTKLEDGTYSLM